MTNVTRRIPAEVFPPGEFIREELAEREWTQSDLAAILNRPLPAINEIIAGKKAITPETAQALGDAFGTGPELWLNLENAYRLALATPSDKDVARRARLYEAVPVKDLVKREWIEWSDDVSTLENNILQFFRTDSLEGIDSRKFAARKSSTYNETTLAEWAWYCRARELAETLHVGNYSEDTLRQSGLQELHALTSSEEESRRVPGLLADLGIRLVLVNRLPKTPVDGAAFWLDEHSPAIALSMRFDRIDGFWFTLAHELAHILQGDDPGPESNLVGKDRRPTNEKPEIEQAADAFAANFLIPHNEIESFIARVRPLYSKVRINQFANRIGVHPGIVVGQLQHRREIGWTHSREMLVKVCSIISRTALVDGD